MGLSILDLLDSFLSGIVFWIFMLVFDLHLEKAFNFRFEIIVRLDFLDRPWKGVP